jgi:alkylated DNA repair protein (DNA oxidative demethylase)
VITPGAVLLRGYALPFVTDVLASLEMVAAKAPFRHMTTP